MELSQRSSRHDDAKAFRVCSSKDAVSIEKAIGSHLTQTYLIMKIIIYKVNFTLLI